MVFVMTGAFIAFDMVTGLVKALMKKEFNSSIMREGLFHKSGSLLCVLLGVMVDYAQSFLDLGVTIPVAVAICTYIVLMEIGSIIENVCEINPEIMPEKLRGLFTKLSKDNDNGVEN